MILVLIVAVGCESAPVNIAVTSQPTATLPIGVSLSTRTPAPTRAFQQQTATPLPTATPAPTATPIIYTVQSGDTLLDIAIVNGITVADITTLNPAVNPNLLSVGDALLLPTPEGGGAAVILDETAVSASLQIEQVQLYPLPQGSGWLLGEVRNVGEGAAEDVQLALRLRGLDGEVVWETAVWLPAPLLPSGRALPFGSLVNALPAGAQPEIEVVRGRNVVTVGSRLFDFAGLDVQLAEQTVRGALQNGGSTAAERVTLLLSLYDSSGRLVGFQQQIVAERLEVGQVQPFEVPIAPPGGTAVSIELLAWGTAVVEGE